MTDNRQLTFLLIMKHQNLTQEDFQDAYVQPEETVETNTEIQPADEKVQETPEKEAEQGCLFREW